MRRFVRVLLTAAAAVLGVMPAVAHAQTGRARFDIVSVGDSTFTFSIRGNPWVSRGQSGLAVDPAHGDELIAQFRVIEVTRDVATALVTGQTARLTTTHVAILKEPRPAFYREPLFWVGALAGGVVGFVLHSH